MFCWSSLSSQTSSNSMPEPTLAYIKAWETAVIFWGTVTGIILLSLGGSQTVIMRESREAIIAKAVQMLFEGLKSSPAAKKSSTRTRRRKPAKRRNGGEDGQ